MVDVSIPRSSIYKSRSSGVTRGGSKCGQISVWMVNPGPFMGKGQHPTNGRQKTFLNKCHFAVEMPAPMRIIPFASGLSGYPRRGRSSGVERNLAKVEVVSSNLIARSISFQ